MCVCVIYFYKVPDCFQNVPKYFYEVLDCFRNVVLTELMYIMALEARQ